MSPCSSLLYKQKNRKYQLSFWFMKLKQWLVELYLCYIELYLCCQQVPWSCIWSYAFLYLNSWPNNCFSVFQTPVQLFVPRQMSFCYMKKMLTGTMLCKFRCKQVKFCHMLAWKFDLWIKDGRKATAVNKHNGFAKFVGSSRYLFNWVSYELYIYKCNWDG